MSSAENQAANYRGIIAMIAACACFSANDAATKFATGEIPVSQIVAMRAVFTLLFVLLIMAVRGEFVRIRHLRDPFLHLRGFSEALAGVVIIFALSRMPLANLTAILMLQPFLMTVIGASLLGETVGWRRWSAVAAGFAGVLLVMQPATDAFDIVSLVALAAALLVLVRDLLVRWIAKDTPTTVVTLATAAFSVPVGALGALGEDWVMPGLYPFAAVVISSAFLVFAFIFMIVAFRGTDVSAVSPFRYSVVLFAVIFGFVVFAEFPDGLALAGMGVIVAAGLYMLHREAMRRRRARADG